MDYEEKVLPDMLKQMIDVQEDYIFKMDEDLLKTILIDRTTNENIIWATKDYENLGIGFAEYSQITTKTITGIYANLIQPRVSKRSDVKNGRTKERAEVFTPSWLCNHQNNLVDEKWFGRKNVFNIETEKSWITNKSMIDFSGTGKRWEEYIYNKSLEICCGEAPYLVSRYDTVTGESINISDRIGILDRKLRIINENARDEEWVEWTIIAYKSVYGYEYQGDNLLLARENLLFTFIDNYFLKFRQMPSIDLMTKICDIISWNVWQMDGLNYVVPLSCKPVKVGQMSLFDVDVTEEPCPGCDKQLHHLHTGQYAKIYDWRMKKIKTYFSIVKGDSE